VLAANSAADYRRSSPPSSDRHGQLRNAADGQSGTSLRPETGINRRFIGSKDRQEQPVASYVRFDTTATRCEQSPGATMTSAEKPEVARSLARQGVESIEAGHPAASRMTWKLVRRIAIEVGNPADGTRPPVICGLARTTPHDIEKAWEAVRPAASPGSTLFLATSEFTCAQAAA